MKLLRNHSLNSSSGQFSATRYKVFLKWMDYNSQCPNPNNPTKAGLTEFFWVRSGSPLVAALFAASVYGVLAKIIFFLILISHILIIIRCSPRCTSSRAELRGR